MNALRFEATFDANLSPKLTIRLAELFPGPVHVFSSGVGRRTPDEDIWEYARLHNFIL